MKKVWSSQNKYETWLRVELAAMKAMEEHGVIPPGGADELKRRIKKVSPERIDEIEATTRHDVIAFLAHIEEMAGEASRFMHFGMTSSDVLDTAFALQLKRAADLILKELSLLMEALKKRAYRHRRTPVAGRTHGMHAQPVSLGLVFAIWYEELGRSRRRLRAARAEISCGKLSGAVGTYQHLSPQVEETSMKLLGLTPEPVSNQIVQRDRHASFFSALALCGSSIEKIAVTVRHWQRTEVAEVSEAFKKGQKGSSAMPHKKNPIISENLCGLSRLLRAYAQASLENVALWHERDISHSSVERVIGPDTTAALHFMLRRATKLVSGLVVDEKMMVNNLERSGGLVFSESVMNHLIGGGLRRQEAYVLVQRNALKSIERKETFMELLLRDKEIVRRIGRKKIKDSFSIMHALKHVDTIFKRVFGNDT